MSNMQLEAVKNGDTCVVMKTNKGDIKIKLFADKAPKTVNNFITHAKNGYYDGLIFHRIIKGFMIQGGDPTGTGRGGESIYGRPFEDECCLELRNYRGALAMANAGPNTNGSQFFIVDADTVDAGLVSQMRELEDKGFPKEVTDNYVRLGGTPWLDFKHTVFGQVVEGMDTVESISNVKTGAGDKPIDDVIIISISVE